MNFAFRALAALHQFLAPTAHRSLMNDDEDLMSKSFCNECCSHTCKHCLARHSVIDIGEPIPDNIQRISACGPILSPPFSPMPRRTIIPPPPPTALVVPKQETKQSIIIDAKFDDFVSCNFCQNKVKKEYLTQHFSMHTHNFTPRSKPIEQAAALATIHTPLLPRHTEAPKDKTKIPHLKSVEHYVFRHIDAISAASSVSQSGRISDFTVSFFLKEQTTFTDVSWRGSGQYTSKDNQRFVIHIAYDSVEDYYLVVCKMVKRSQYSLYDTEELTPEHICNQDELLTDIKRSMLYFGIPPKTAYKMFRKLFKKPDISIEYDKNNRACMSETSNSSELLQKIAPKETSYHYGYEGHME